MNFLHYRKKVFPKSHVGYVWLCIALVSFAIVFEAAKWNNYTVLVSDPGGYYLYLPSAFINRDLGDGSYVGGVHSSYYSIEHNRYNQVLLSNKRAVFKYTLGMSVFYSPYFFAAHAYATLTNKQADGYSVPYQQSIEIGCLCYVLLGLWVLGLELRRYFSDANSALSLLIISLGTNLLQYSTLDSPMSHGTLFMLSILLLRATRQWYQKMQWRYAVSIGLLSGLIILIRPSELPILAIPVFWGITDLLTLNQRVHFWLKNKSQIFVAITLIILICGTQLLFWKVVGGSWFIDTYEGAHFDFFHPHIIEGLFSFKKGWLVYSPLMLFSLFGVCLLKKYAPDIWLPVLFIVPVTIYIVFCWEQWWYGGGFGSRPLISLYALLSFSLASFCKYFARFKPALFVLVISLLVLSLIQHRQYRLGVIDCCDMTWQKYKEHFLKLK